MKLLVLILLLSSIFSYFIITSEDENIKHDASVTTKTKLEQLHDKFSKLDINSKELNLDKAIKEVKEARKIYPLDDKLKMIDIELEHKKANHLN